jgi:hypothetical protein
VTTGAARAGEAAQTWIRKNNSNGNSALFNRTPNPTAALIPGMAKPFLPELGTQPESTAPPAIYITKISQGLKIFYEFHAPHLLGTQKAGIY